MANVIEVENLSKMYRLGEVGTGTLSHDLNRWWHKVRGLEDPYMKVTQSNDRTKAADSDYVWSLKDIDFSVAQGDIVGIIGRNGAGKSTLLKVLSSITSPTTGSIKIKGRIASLLEVGTGFHPEMTGRENIYMNGTIMGMRKHEITSKLEEIVEFAGISKYLDTPVKRYSSGMMVRLGFAIAAHLEPEILIVDEVLAVGDAEFQKKCIGKMQDVSQNQGRTVLFVSHNMASMQSLCKTSIVLENGKSIFSGDMMQGIDFYIKKNKEIISLPLRDRKSLKGGRNFKFTDISIKNENGEVIKDLKSGFKYFFEIKYKLDEKINLLGIRMLLIDSRNNIRILCNTGIRENGSVKLGHTKEGIVLFTIDKFPLPKGEYSIQLSCFSDEGIEDDIDNTLMFSTIGGDFYNTGKEPHITEGVFVEYNVNFL